MLGGDFNIPLNPLVDTSNGKTSVKYKSLKQIKSLLHSLQLIDAWRFLNPDGRDFTFYSFPHEKYTCIDYLFVTQKDLLVLMEARIGISSISDHSPVALTLDLSKKQQKSQTWRLNSSLISDPVLVDEIKMFIKQFFERNNTPDMDPLAIWEAHNCTIRGELIKMGAKRKREREDKINKIANRIHELELLHKQYLSSQTALELLEARKALQQILDNRTKRFLFFRKRSIMSQVTKQEDFWQRH